MSSGDFAAELRQSVADHIALIQTAARAAKARIGEAVPTDAAPAPLPPAAVNFDEPRPAVNFFADEPVFEEVPAESPEPLPEGAIAFDDAYANAGVDDEGIPVWEDAP